MVAVVLGLMVVALVAVTLGPVGRAQSPYSVEVDDDLYPLAEPTDGWVTYVNTDYGFSLLHPSNWKVSTGNGHAPSLPANIVTFRSKPATSDVTVIPLHNSAGYDCLRVTRQAATGFWGDLDKLDKKKLTTKNVKGMKVARAIYVQPPVYSSVVQLVLTTFTGNNAAYILLTQVAIDPTSGIASSRLDSDRLVAYEKIVESFSILPQGPKRELPAVPIVPISPESNLRDDSSGMTSLSAIAATFRWPTNGYVGYIYRRPVSYSPGYHNGIDVWTNKGGSGNQGSKGNAVYPPYSGQVTWIYTDPGSIQQGIRIEHGNVGGTNLWTHYWHMADEYTGQSYIEGGLLWQQVDTNRLLGYQGNRRWSGWGDIIVHLHLTVANGSADSNDIDPSPYFDTKLNWNDPGHIGWHHYVERSGSSPPPCPTSGDVILYYDANYGCAGRGENSGYVIRNGTGFQNVPGDFNDKASSIRIRSGWSVKLFEHADHGGGWACRNGNDDTFWGDKFNNNVDLNDQVSSFEVFSSPECGQRPPNTPWPDSPSDWHVARDGRAPNLCWGNPGDPNGDPLEFYAEVYDSPVNTNSGWISGTCWRPSQLDGHYHTYKWRVKARDIPHHAQSGWSDPPWHFSIEAPDEPPSISFDTANGNSDSRIDSRDRNWTFRGTASDPEGRLGHIEFRCSGDNCGYQAGHTDGGNWSHTQNDMAGQNDVYFVAHDNPKDQQTASRHLDLRIDLAAPFTTISLNNEANPARWPAWFREPVQVRLKAEDGNTGRARSGVKEVRYRLDGGGWQTQGGDTVAFTVSSDGTHTVDYYAVDNVGNQETTRSATYKIDQTPPTPPGGVSETHGVVSNQWQKAHNTPTFTWAASSDATSGVWGYQFYFGPDPNGVAYQTFLASDPREWTPQPGGVRTGTYYLRGRTRDNAGNWSNWLSLFTFRYDGTPPENPGEATHAAGIKNDTWQRITNLADFTWPVPHDEGSGIKGYYRYWGADPAGTSSDFTTNTQYQIPDPLCGTNEACTGYLRLRSVDNVDNRAEDWSTAFVLRYDNAPPTADFTFNGGVTQTTQTLVNLHIAANDQGSGVQEMRLSGDGKNWTTWEVYAIRRPWTIPAISRQWWPVYLQVRDGVGLESAVVMHDIYLDVNPGQPRSENFRLFDHTMSAGAGEHVSLPSGYKGRSTVGQVMDSARINSLNYTIVGGYEAGSQALPIVEPGHDEFTFINGIFASGTGADTLRSPLYEMWGTVGEVGLPNNETTLNSSGFQHQPGFLAAAPPSGTPTPTPTPGPTPTPTPTPACEFPRISINNAAVFTNDPDVTLNICAPRAQEMMISNDGGFPGATWESYAETKPWTITTYGQYVLPRFVYAAFKDTDGTVHGTYFDDIIYDPNPPEGTIAVGDSVLASGVAEGQRSRGAEERGGSEAGGWLSCGSVKCVQRLGETVLAHPVALLGANANGTVDVYINARDDNSGLAEMQISASADFSDTNWEPYSALKPWAPEGGDGIKTVYARFRDGADNVSDATDANFALDTMPPFGGMAIDRRVVGPDIISTTVYLGSEDNLSGVTDLRISADPDFTDAAWQPYTTTLTWPISLTAQSEGSLYVQYRDLAGNASEVYSDTYLVDTTPPVVYVEVAAGDTLTRTVTVLAYDELAAVETMYLSNDPLMIEGVVTLPYTDTVEWPFDERRVVWVQVADSVGNVTEPYPAYAAIACPGDLDSSRTVNIADVMLVASRWRTSCYNLDPDNNLDTPNYEGRYDLDHDCDIDIVDIMLVVVHWGETC
jgi:hypothetical protein